MNVEERSIFFRQLADDLIEYISYHDGEEVVIKFLLKIGYTVNDLVQIARFDENTILEQVVKGQFDL